MNPSHPSPCALLGFPPMRLGLGSLRHDARALSRFQVGRLAGVAVRELVEVEPRGQVPRLRGESNRNLPVEKWGSGNNRIHFMGFGKPTNCVKLLLVAVRFGGIGTSSRKGGRNLSQELLPFQALSAMDFNSPVILGRGCGCLGQRS